MNISEHLRDVITPAVVIPPSHVSNVSRQTIDTYTYKGLFVINELSTILRKIDDSIVGASYIIDEFRTEYVRVHYRDGSYYDKNVTAYDFGTIAAEVITRII